jgi:hypothetical protein
MGGVCGTHGGSRAVHIEFWCGNRRERDHLEDVSEDGEMILRWILPAAPFLRSVLIFCHVRQAIPTGLLASGFPPKPFMKFLFSHKRDNL